MANVAAKSLRARIVKEMEAGSTDFLSRAGNSGDELSVWTKVYTANQAMLSAMEQGSMIPALLEICSNLLGCEQVAIFQVRSECHVQFFGEQGIGSQLKAQLAKNARALVEAINLGVTRLTCDDENGCLSSLGVTALVPLWKDEHSSAAVALFELLPQRNGYDAEDREILQLLAIYAGPCLKGQQSRKDGR